MKLTSKPSRTPSRLSDSLSRQLNMYALAASAAGVGMLALAQPAEARIIYTKANKNIGPNTTLHLDLNHDGIADFDLKDTFSTNTTGGLLGQLTVSPDEEKNAVWGHKVHWAYASALSANVRVGPKRQFLPGRGMMARTFVSGGVRLPRPLFSYGFWCNVENRYLGFKFVIKGKTHFGWARLNVSCADFRVYATLTGYAYETIPNKPIIAGKTKGPDVITVQPATLGRLALGRN